jgi:ribosomal protein L28
MNSCYHCGKSAMFGRSHTHHRGVAGGRWKKRAPKTPRVFRVNLVRLSIIEDGKEKRVKLCAKCLKRVRKDVKEGRRPFVQLTTTHVISSVARNPATEGSVKK